MAASQPDPPQNRSNAPRFANGFRNTGQTGEGEKPGVGSGKIPFKFGGAVKADNSTGTGNPRRAAIMRRMQSGVKRPMDNKK